jgi:hypothetical protein
VEYHLVVFAPDDTIAHSNLVQLVELIEIFSSRPLWREATWVFCDRCGCSVDVDLIHLSGHRYAEDGDFYCSDCWGRR